MVLLRMRGKMGFMASGLFNGLFRIEVFGYHLCGTAQREQECKANALQFGAVQAIQFMIATVQQAARKKGARTMVPAESICYPEAHAQPERSMRCIASEEGAIHAVAVRRSDDREYETPDG